jgi:hypothetical protein
MRYFLIFLMLGCSSVVQADTMIKVRKVTISSNATPNVQNPSTHRDVYYRHGTMRKKESFGSDTTPIADIANCETKTGYLIDLTAHEYRTYNVVKLWPEGRLSEYLQKNPASAVQVESRTVDTGEQKVFFNHPARHLITTIKRADGSGGEETIDGWYIDHELADNHCTPGFARTDPLYVLGTALVRYPEVPQFHHTGPLPTGLAVQLARTVKEGKSGQTFTFNETIEELSDVPIPPSSFDLPTGFHENPRLLL